jgi:hypothetical protein
MSDGVSMIDGEGLIEVAGLAGAGAGRVAGIEPPASAVLRSVERSTDAASVAGLLQRVSAALGDIALDVETRATRMAGAEAGLLTVLAGALTKDGGPVRTWIITWEQERAWEELHRLLARRDAYLQIGGFASAALVAEMDQRLAQLTAGFDRSDWSAVAHLDAGIDPMRWHPEDGLAANDEIVRSIYTFYGDVFLANPEVQWAGLANLVGAAFYGGWQDLYTLRTVVDDSDRAEYLWDVLDLPTLPDTVWDVVDFIDAIPLTPLDLTAMVAVDSLAWLEVKMLAMQREIFRDISWQLAAYNYAGPSAVESAAHGRRDEADLAAAWADIASGDPVRVAEGNEALLRREQFDIIQDDYDDIVAYRTQLGRMMSQVLTLISNHGVPGGRPYREVVTRDIQVPIVFPDAPSLWPPWELVPVQVEPVRVTLPRGNIADFDDRWEWIENDLLPAYRALLDDPAALRGLITTPLEVRAEDGRLFPSLPYRS